MPKAKKPKYTPSDPAPYAPIHQLYDDAIEYRHQNPTECWEKIAFRFTPINKDTLRQRFNGGGTKAACGGHNRLFSDEEERGIIAIIDRYTSIGTPLGLDLLGTIFLLRSDRTPINCSYGWKG